MAGSGRPAADADVFRAVADPTRRAALEVLGRRRELSVTELAEHLGIGMPMLSRHLAVLREAGLVSQQQIGRQRLYRLEPRPLRELFDWASMFSEFWDDRIRNLREYLDRTAKREGE
jgi:DNA-binding transcriptional ArsR family regulator